jgi:hypothetical protein
MAAWKRLTRNTCKWLFIIPLLVGSSGRSQPNKEQYELEERCGKRADEVFRREYETKEEKDSLFNYRNHYNPRLNKCFFLEISTSMIGRHTMATMYRLFDLNENKELGNFYKASDGVMSCVVGTHSCASEAEWNTLISPYMGEGQ